LSALSAYANGISSKPVDRSSDGDVRERSDPEHPDGNEAGADGMRSASVTPGTSLAAPVDEQLPLPAPLFNLDRHRSPRLRFGDTSEMTDRDPEDLVTVVGVVHHVTALGVFLDVGGGRVFFGNNCIKPLAQPLSPGEPATLRVARWYAKQEGLIE
jgi:hypothetical protein